VTQGGLAFVASDPFGLSVLDVSTPTTPRLLGSADTPFVGTRLAVTAVGPGAPNRAVVVGTTPDGFAHLWVLDVSTPTTPQVIGELATTLVVGAQSGFKAVALDATGTTAALAVATAGLWVVDLSTPTLPSVLGSYDTPGIAYGVALNTTVQGSAAPGTLAYVADGAGGLKILDLSAPAQPALVSSLALAGTQVDLGLTGDGLTACLVSNTGPLTTVDVSVPAAPVFRRSVSASGAATRIAVEGSTAAVLASSAQTLNTYIDLFDVSTPAAPVKTNSTVVGPSPSGRGLALAGGLVSLAADSQGVKLYDATTLLPTAALKDSFTPRAVAAAESTVVVVGSDTATGQARLEVRDVSAPGAPVLLGSLENAAVSAFTGVALNAAGSQAVVSMGVAGIWVIDVASASVLGGYDTPGTANAVALNAGPQGSYGPGQLAYVADGVQGLEVLALTQPAQPVLVGSLSLAGTQVDVALAGTSACVLSNTGPLAVVDVSTPSLPVFKKSVTPTGSPTHLAVSGSLVGVLSNDSVNAYLDLFSIATPAQPTHLGAVTVAAAPQGARGVALGGSTAYVAGTTAGLALYDVSVPSAPALRSTTPTVGAALAVALGPGFASVADFPATLDLVAAGQ